MSIVDRVLGRIQRFLVVGAATPAPTRAPVPSVPQGRPPTRSRRLVSAAGSALLPVVFGVALIPVRDRLAESLSLLMVLPVLVVALVAGARSGAIAAVASSVTFGVLHTQPYGRPTIDDPDDVVEMIVLLLIGITAGYLAESAQRAAAAARVRRDELAAVLQFLDGIGTTITGDDLAGRAGASIGDLLGARECVWRPGYRGTSGPVLRPDGTLTAGVAGESHGGGGALPPTIEIPVGQPPVELGRFVVRTDPSATISLEERQAAATIAATLGRCLETRR